MHDQKPRVEAMIPLRKPQAMTATDQAEIAASAPSEIDKASPSPFRAATPSPFLATPASPFGARPSRADPFQTGPLRTGPFQPAGAALSPLAPRLPNPFDDPAARTSLTGGRAFGRPVRKARASGAAQVRRHVFIAPPTGPRRSGPYCLPVEEIDYIYEFSPGDFRWRQGDTCDFDDVADFAAEWCDCAQDHDAPHSHPLQAVQIDGRCCPCWADLDQFDVDPATARREWEAVLPLIREAREAILANPRLLFRDPDTRTPIALEILSVAGRACPPGEDPADVVTEAMTSDGSVRAAAADLGAVYFSRGIGQLSHVAEVIGRLERDDFHLRHPDELQLMLFHPAPAATSGRCVELRGEHWVRRVDYKSAFDTDPFDCAWAVGWRELVMEPTGAAA